MQTPISIFKYFYSHIIINMRTLITFQTTLKLLCVDVFVTKLFWFQVITGKLKIQLWNLATSVVNSRGTTCPSAQIILLSSRAEQIPRGRRREAETAGVRCCCCCFWRHHFYWMSIHTVCEAITVHSGNQHREQQEGSGGWYCIWLWLNWNKYSTPTLSVSLFFTDIISCTFPADWAW